MRFAVTRTRPRASGLRPLLRPKGCAVSCGAVNGSYPVLVQSSSIAWKVALRSSESIVSR